MIRKRYLVDIGLCEIADLANFIYDDISGFPPGGGPDPPLSTTGGDIPPLLAKKYIKKFHILLSFQLK